VEEERLAAVAKIEEERLASIAKAEEDRRQAEEAAEEKKRQEQIAAAREAAKAAHEAHIQKLALAAQENPAWKHNQSGNGDDDLDSLFGDDNDATSPDTIGSDETLVNIPAQVETSKCGDNNSAVVNTNQSMDETEEVDSMGFFDFAAAALPDHLTLPSSEPDSSLTLPTLPRTNESVVSEGLTMPSLTSAGTEEPSSEFTLPSSPPSRPQTLSCGTTPLVLPSEESFGEFIMPSSPPLPTDDEHAGGLALPQLPKLPPSLSNSAGSDCSQVQTDPSLDFMTVASHQVQDSFGNPALPFDNGIPRVVDQQWNNGYSQNLNPALLQHSMVQPSTVQQPEQPKAQKPVTEGRKGKKKFYKTAEEIEKNCHSPAEVEEQYAHIIRGVRSYVDKNGRPKLEKKRDEELQDAPPERHAEIRAFYQEKIDSQENNVVFKIRNREHEMRKTLDKLANRASSTPGAQPESSAFQQLPAGCDPTQLNGSGFQQPQMGQQLCSDQMGQSEHFRRQNAALYGNSAQPQLQWQQFQQPQVWNVQQNDQQDFYLAAQLQAELQAADNSAMPSTEPPVQEESQDTNTRSFSSAAGLSSDIYNEYQQQQTNDFNDCIDPALSAGFDLPDGNTPGDYYQPDDNNYMTPSPMASNNNVTTGTVLTPYTPDVSQQMTPMMQPTVQQDTTQTPMSNIPPVALPSSSPTQAAGTVPKSTTRKRKRNADQRIFGIVPAAQTAIRDYGFRILTQFHAAARVGG
jgi:hypothetical protein